MALTSPVDKGAAPDDLIVRLQQVAHGQAWNLNEFGERTCRAAIAEIERLRLAATASEQRVKDLETRLAATIGNVIPRPPLEIEL